MKLNGWYLKSEKWRIFRDFDSGLRPKDIKTKYKIKLSTLYRYFQEWKKIERSAMPMLSESGT